MLQFALFGGENYYPAGGWEDFQDTYATLEEAVAGGRVYLNEDLYEGYGRWYHVVDLSTRSIVAQG